MRCPMKYILKLFALVSVTICCISCNNGQESQDLASDNDPVSLLMKFNDQVKHMSKVSKEEFSLLVKSYKELEDSLAMAFVSDSTISDIHRFTHISITQAQVAARLCEMADSCDWTFEDIPGFQQTIYSYSQDNKSNPLYRQAVDFYNHLNHGTYKFRSWDILIRDYSNFLSEWSDAKVSGIDDLYRYLSEENDLFTALVSNCIHAGTIDFSSVIDGTDEVSQRLLADLMESGVPSIQVRTVMYVRSNHRLIQTASCGIEALSSADKLSAEQFDLGISLLLSPFICVNRQLVCARTAEQIAQIKQIGKSVPIVLDKCCSNIGLKGIYINDMPLSIIRKIITDDIE